MESRNQITWHIETVPLKRIKNFTKNPRCIDKKQFNLLEKLIKNFGLIDKPILNEDLTIIGGHQRVKILKKMKGKTVECWLPNRQLIDAEVEELCIGLNKNQGQWDWELLANEWEPTDLFEWGFSEEELMGISKEDDEEYPKKKEKSKKTCPNCGEEI